LRCFPEDTVPRYLLRDRGAVCGAAFRKRIAGLGIEEVKTAPHSPWQFAVPGLPVRTPLGYVAAAIAMNLAVTVEPLGKTDESGTGRG
jgi:hypothetical protein